jgi:AcrR family transcriptional regulator
MKSINKDGSINKFSQIREKQKALILKNAFNLFLTRPFSEITMQDVANKAKISRPTLYKYFDNIDQIIFTLEESIMKNLLSDTRSAVAQQAQNGKELVLDFAKSSFEQAQREEEEFYFISLFDNYNHSRAADDSMNEKYRQVFDNDSIFSHLVEKGQADGSIRKDLDPRKSLFMILNVVTAMNLRFATVGTKGLPKDQSLTVNDIEAEFLRMVDAYLSPRA